MDLILDGTLAKIEQNRVDLNKLTLSHLQGLFVMLGAGILVGIVCLVSEILFHKIASVKNITGEIKRTVNFVSTK